MRVLPGRAGFARFSSSLADRFVGIPLIGFASAIGTIAAFGSDPTADLARLTTPLHLNRLRMTTKNDGPGKRFRRSTRWWNDAGIDWKAAQAWNGSIEDVMSSTGNEATPPVRILTTPSVYLVSKQVVQPTELNRFLTDHGVTWESDSEVGAEVLTETAGRVCYMSFAKPRPGGNSAYLHHIKEVGHGSVLEHAVWSFIITGISRTLTHELIRHRAGFGYSQLSQRYVDESVAEYVEPAIIAGDPELHAVWLDAVNHAHAAYLKLAELLNAKLANPEAAASAMLPPDADRTTRRKTARQAARSVLPNATETKIFVTANARGLRHFLEQRGSRFAEPEIRQLANVLLDLLAVESPNLFGDYEKVPLPDGTFDLLTPFKKV